jgi:hypothetical protein
VADFDFNIGDPDPEYLENNRRILLRTILRKEQYSNGSVNRDAIIKLEDYPSVWKFFNAFNGDWNSRRIQFWTAGRNISKEDAKLLLFGALVE